MSHSWFIVRDGREDGPFQASDLRRLVKAGDLTESDRLRREDQSGAVAAGRVRGLFQSAGDSAARGATAAADDASRRAMPPPPPPVPPPRPRSDVDSANVVWDLYRSSYESRFVSESALLAGASLSQRRREGVGGYAGLAAGERVLLAHDSTLFGVGTEGFVLTDRAIAWNFPDGNRGRVPLAAIRPVTVFADVRAGLPPALCFTATADHRVPGKSLPPQAMEQLAAWIARAARVARGLDADLVLPMAARLVGTGDVQGALDAWRSLIDDDILLFSRVRSEVSRAHTASPQSQELLAFHAELEMRGGDLDAGWLLPRRGQAPEMLTAADLRDRWRRGELLAESSVRHVSDGAWRTAGGTPAAEGQRTVYVSDMGEFDEAQFRACVRGLANQDLGYESLLVFGPTAARVDSAAGKPILHIGLTADELILAWLAQEGHVVVERSPLCPVVWKLEELATGRFLEVATAKRTTRFALRPSAGADHFITAASGAFLAGAEKAAAEDRRTDTARLLDRVVVTDASRHRVGELRARSKADDEVLVVYEGGHPDTVEPCVGTLRLDDDGIEFRSIAPETTTFFRIPFERVVDFASPQRGAMPDDLSKSLFGPNSLLSAGLGVAAQCLIPGGAMLVRSLSGSLAADKQAGPPVNRFVVVVSLSGTSYRLHFDVVGQTVAEMSQKAKTFWSRTARAKPRFFKATAAAAAAPAGGGADAESRTLLREIRDSLATIANLLAVGLAERSDAPGDAITDEIRRAMRRMIESTVAERLRASGLVAAQAPRAAAIVVACPACGVRVRAARPGVIRCAGCSTGMRLGADLFRARATAAPGLGQPAGDAAPHQDTHRSETSPPGDMEP